MIFSLIKGASIYTLITLTQQLITFCCVAILARVISPSAFGLSELIVLAITIMPVVAGLEISQGLARFFHDASEEEKKEYISTAFWLTIFGSCIVVILLYFFKNIVISWTGEVEEFRLIPLIILFASLAYVNINVLRYALMHKSVAISQIGMSLCQLIGIVIFVGYFKWGMSGYIFSMLGGYAWAVISSTWMVRKWLAYCLSREKLKNMYSFALPLVPSSLGLILKTWAAAIVVKTLLGEVDLGIFRMSARIALMLGFVSSGFSSVLTPMIYKHYKEKNTPKNIEMIYRLYLTVMGISALSIVCFKELVIEVLGGHEYNTAGAIIPYMLISALVVRATIFFPGLWIEKKTNVITIINLCASALSIVLAYVFISFWGILGAALSVLIAELLLLIVHYIMSQRYYPIPMKWTKQISTIIIILLCGLMAMFFASYTQGDQNYISGMLFFAVGTILIIILNREELQMAKNYLKIRKNS